MLDPRFFAQIFVGGSLKLLNLAADVVIKMVSTHPELSRVVDSAVQLAVLQQTSSPQALFSAVKRILSKQPAVWVSNFLSGERDGTKGQTCGVLTLIRGKTIFLPTYSVQALDAILDIIEDHGNSCSLDCIHENSEWVVQFLEQHVDDGRDAVLRRWQRVIGEKSA